MNKDVVVKRARITPRGDGETTEILWEQLDPCSKGRHVEPTSVVRGRDVTTPVDLHDKPWRMKCSCGRVRYARSNALAQIRQCWICTRAARNERRRRAEDAEDQDDAQTDEAR